MKDSPTLITHINPTTHHTLIRWSWSKVVELESAVPAASTVMLSWRVTFGWMAWLPFHMRAQTAPRSFA